MKFQVSVSSVFECSLERAFKTPMLCDVSKIHTGFGFMPKITHTTDDEDWGQVGSSKKIFVDKSMTQAGGFSSVDNVVERVENKYWKIQVDNLQTWMLGFHKFEGEWKTTELEENRVLVEYHYNLHCDKPLYYPFNWLFAKTFWKIYMKRVLENVRFLAYNNEPYEFD